MERISATQLSESLQTGQNVVVVDVREGFNGGRVPGAVNLPESQFAARVSELDQYKSADTIVVHCMRSKTRGPKCAGLLDSHFAGQEGGPKPKVVVLDGGFDGWVRQFRDSDSSKIENWDQAAFDAELQKH